MNEEEIKRLSELVRLEIKDNEMPTIAKDLESMVAYVSLISEASTKVEKESNTVLLKNVLREDASPHEPGVHTEDILHAAPSREKDYIKVKKILK